MQQLFYVTPERLGYDSTADNGAKHRTEGPVTGSESKYCKDAPLYTMVDLSGFSASRSQTPYTMLDPQLQQ